jgi:Cys-rich four helix bundle protein (predicted Tat secretion target)
MIDLTSFASANHFPDAGLSRWAVLNAGLTAGIVMAVPLASTGNAAAADPDAGHDIGHAGARYQAVIDAALTCVNRGDVCLNHCITLLGSGDTSLKDCIRTVSAMLPMCAALARYAALEAGRLKELTKLCADVCADCETECKKHADHHAACKACAESCAACIKECKALIAA